MPERIVHLWCVLQQYPPESLIIGAASVLFVLMLIVIALQDELW